MCRVGVGLVRYNRFISYLGEPWLLGDLNCLDMVIRLFDVFGLFNRLVNMQQRTLNGH